MNAMYASIIRRFCWDYESFHEQYRDTLGTILCVRYPLPRAVLGRLLGDRAANLDSTLHTLSPILAGVDGEDQVIGITVTHESVREYITVDAMKTPDRKFAISPYEVHALLAERCIQIMDENISDEWIGLVSSQQQHSAALGEQSSTLLSKNFEDHVLYAIEFWDEHAASASSLSSLGALDYSRFIAKWQASYLIKIASHDREKDAIKLLKTQTAGGFLTTRVTPLHDGSDRLTLPLETLITTVTTLGYWAQTLDYQTRVDAFVLASRLLLDPSPS
ncbi:hypothetical protein DL93DRAFT_2230221 [Clavulina sp. PMI_390]|nr:hypothetical protein DL93DRAFT_2230221 [Clavulina sp. PMI_390]